MRHRHNPFEGKYDPLPVTVQRAGFAHQTTDLDGVRIPSTTRWVRSIEFSDHLGAVPV